WPRWHMPRSSSPAATARSWYWIIPLMPDLLLLGGTSEARACAAELVRRGFDVVSSLAGRVAAPRLPAGAVRIGGFGGPDAMARWLAENRVRAVVDATHPFAERIGTSAVTACASAGVPLLRL